MKIVETILLKIVIFTAVKNRCILHGRVFVIRKNRKKMSRFEQNHRTVTLSQSVEQKIMFDPDNA